MFRHNLHSFNVYPLFWPLICLSLPCHNTWAKSVGVFPYTCHGIKKAAVAVPKTWTGWTNSLPSGSVLHAPDHPLGGSLLDSFRFISIFLVLVRSHLGMDQLASNDSQRDNCVPWPAGTGEFAGSFPCQLSGALGWNWTDNKIINKKTKQWALLLTTLDSALMDLRSQAVPWLF